MTDSRDFDRLIPHMKRAGFIATALAAIITAQFGWALGENILAKLSLAGLLALCTFIVGYALVAAHQAFSRNMPVIGAASVALFAVACSVEFLSHTGFTAANRDATVQAASLTRIAYEDTRHTIRTLERDIDRMQDRLKLAPLRTADAAQAAIDRAKADRFWKLTDGCAETKGPQTRKFCDGYASAVADVSLATERMTIQAELKAKQDELAAAKRKSAITNIGHASGASQGIILASMATMNDKPDAQATYWAGVGIAAILALAAICFGGLLNLIAYAFDAPAKIVKAATTEAITVVEKVIRERDPRLDAIASGLKRLAA